MSDQATSIRNWFEQGGRAYARFRPEYPPELATHLAEIALDNRLAVDVGCGNGQLTQLLAPHFKALIGLDPSADQIANAIPHERITYQCARAEQLPLVADCASLITAAQAAHWFNLPVFYQEVRRIAAPECVLALISYGVLNLESALNQRFQKFYWDEIGPYWAPERKLVDSGYATIDFPFEELAVPTLDIKVDWHLSEFLGYLLTWSAVRSAKEAGREKVLLDFADDISSLWGDANITRAISWPINMRIGRL